MYLVIIHAGIKVTINQHWVGSGNYNKTPPNRWWRYIMSYSATFKTSGCFCFIPLCAQGLYLPFLAYTCTLYVSIDVYIYMSVYRQVFSLPYSSTLCYSFWTHVYLNMPYFSRAGWVPLHVDLVLQHNDMLTRICFRQIVFTSHSSVTGLLYGTLSVSHHFSKNFDSTYMIPY